MSPNHLRDTAASEHIDLCLNSEDCYTRHAAAASLVQEFVRMFVRWDILNGSVQYHDNGRSWKVAMHGQCYILHM